MILTYSFLGCTKLSDKTFLNFLSSHENKIQAITVIGKEEGIRGYWKGNLPQVSTIRKKMYWYFLIYVSV